MRNYRSLKITQIYQAFLNDCLVDWLKFTENVSQVQISKLAFDTGCDVLFAPEILRNSLTSTSKEMEGLFITVLRDCPSSLAIPSAARLFRSFSTAMKQHRSTLFPSSHHSAAATSAKDSRFASMQLFVVLVEFVDGGDFKSWAARKDLLIVIEETKLYNAVDAQEGVLVTLKDIAEQALSTIFGNLTVFSNITVSNCGVSEPTSIIANLVVEVLVLLARIDYDILLPLVTQIYTCLYQVRLTGSLTLLIQSNSYAGDITTTAGEF